MKAYKGHETPDQENSLDKPFRVKITLQNGEDFEFQYTSRLDGLEQLFSKAGLITATDFNNLYEEIFLNEDLPEITEEEVNILNTPEGNPIGYTLEDYNEQVPNNNLTITDNDVGVEYTLTFGTKNGKAYTHGAVNRELESLLLKLKGLENKGKGDTEEAQIIRAKHRKAYLSKQHYKALQKYSDGALKPELSDKPIPNQVAEIRAFRKLYPYIYESKHREAEIEAAPKKKFKLS